MHGQNPDKYARQLKMVVCCGLLFIVAMSAYGAWVGLNQDRHEALYSLTQPLLWILSFSFMADGLRRIRKTMDSHTDSVIVYETYFLLVATVALAILCQLLGIILGVYSVSNDKFYAHYYQVMTIVVNSAIWFVQIFVIVIFNKLISKAI